MPASFDITVKNQDRELYGNSTAVVSALVDVENFILSQLEDKSKGLDMKLQVEVCIALPELVEKERICCDEQFSYDGALVHCYLTKGHKGNHSLCLASEEHEEGISI